MNPSEQKLLEELKQTLEGKIQKSIVDAYIADPGSDAVLAPLLEILEQEISKK
jgi:hypothetical protein